MGSSQLIWGLLTGSLNKAMFNLSMGSSLLSDNSQNTDNSNTLSLRVTRSQVSQATRRQRRPLRSLDLTIMVHCHSVYLVTLSQDLPASPVGWHPTFWYS